MTKVSKAAAFLENMTQESVTESVQPIIHEKERRGKRPQAKTRQGLKHIGGYLNPDTVEKVAVLRARLGLDNSQLITLAINELHSKQKAKRAFNDY